ncbi:MAG: hypothetical protein QOE82_333 [Thermoanaerobaculia bacterium]|nr:hypothetical protein [Thermoanaerobaculia bacterium]
MKRDRGILPVVLFELSVMRETVRRFDRLGEPDALRLLSRLTILESKRGGSSICRLRDYTPAWITDRPSLFEQICRFLLRRIA